MPRREAQNYNRVLTGLKIRLDELLVKHGIAETQKEAQALIGAGQVFANDFIADKPGKLVSLGTDIRLKIKCRYVSRGGLKLEKALEHFQIKVEGACCVDIGASTGGFTDCLLQHGAKRVYAVDVAYGQFAWNLRQDDRVIVVERFNARQLSQKEIPEPLDLAVIDASFISLTKLIPPLLQLPLEDKTILALIKPQFELAKDKVTKGGVVKDASLHQEAINKIRGFASKMNLSVIGVVQSPLLGPKGNKEFIIHLKGAQE